VNSLAFFEKYRVVTESLTVAEVFGKRHDHVMRDIETRIKYAGEEFSLLNFEESTYNNNRGWTYKKYILTEEAISLIVFSYNTKEAVQVKIKFI
jgi:Rha family phage regulatory protein